MVLQDLRIDFRKTRVFSGNDVVISLFTENCVAVKRETIVQTINEVKHNHIHDFLTLQVKYAHTKQYTLFL